MYRGMPNSNTLILDPTLSWDEKWERLRKIGKTVDRLITLEHELATAKRRKLEIWCADCIIAEGAIDLPSEAIDLTDAPPFSKKPRLETIYESDTSCKGSSSSDPG